MYNVVTMKDFVGNKSTIEYIRKAVASDNLSHAYLFCGPEGVGKTKAGIYFAKLLLCESEKPLNCNSCPSCKVFAAGNHPDFFHLDSDTVLVDEVRALVSSLDLKPYMGKAKVALISHAEKMTTQALNSLLKTLEEPTVHTTIILTTENQKNLLPTIVSRARALNFGLATEKQIYELLNGELGVKRDEATIFSRLASGRAGVATRLSQEPEAANEILALSSEFNRVFKSQDIYEQITFADKLAGSKDHLLSNLANLELATRSDLMSINYKEPNKTKVTDLISMLDGIARSREMLAANANAKLVMESLLLRSIT